MISTSSAANHLREVSGWQLYNSQLQKMLHLADMNLVGKYGQSKTRRDAGRHGIKGKARLRRAARLARAATEGLVAGL